MFVARVKLNAILSNRLFHQYSFSEPCVCIVGTAKDCDLRIPAEEAHGVSHYHCLMLIEPPRIRVRDLFSRAGTFVNEERIGQSLDEFDLDHVRWTDLHHGDELKVGHSVFRVVVEALAEEPEPEATLVGSV